MQDLPFSLQSFANIRKFNCLYVDKTKYAYQLISQRQSFFLSRPRRFGKSVFLSTLKEILLCKKELFEGLWIHQSPYSWPLYGVISLDFSFLKTTQAETVEQSLCQNLSSLAKEYNLSIRLSSSSPNDSLIVLVRELFNRFGQVAILIDEYDYPILSNLHTERLQETLKVLQSFFATIKGLGDFIHFLFITGVSTFSKAGLFSGMSHPKDLSMLTEYSAICGYTEEEIDLYFTPYLQKMAQTKHLPFLTLKEQLKQFYNGYRFAENAPSVYNPFSFIQALDSQKIGNFWFDSGTPSFLIDILKQEYAKKNTHIFHMEEFQMSEMEPKYFDAKAIPLPALMVQTGYLTLKRFHEGIYTLGFPNLEVQSSLQRHMLCLLLRLNMPQTATFSTNLMNALIHEDIDKLKELLLALYSHIPSRLHISKEHFYHALLLATFQSCGVKTTAEKATADGAIDLVLELSSIIYLIEIKLNKSAKIALQQIEEKQYFLPFLQERKNIRLLGIGLHRKTQKQTKKPFFSLTLESKTLLK